MPGSAQIGLTVQEVAPDFADPVEGYLRMVFQTGKSFANVELQGGTRREPHVVRNWLCSYYPLRAEDGTVSAAVIMSIDITDRKRAETALSQSEARNRDLVEHSVYGISRVTPHGAFLDENSALLAILCCNKADELHALNLMRDVF